MAARVRVRALLVATVVALGVLAGTHVVLSASGVGAVPMSMEPDKIVDRHEKFLKHKGLQMEHLGDRALPHWVTDRRDSPVRLVVRADTDGTHTSVALEVIQAGASGFATGVGGEGVAETLERVLVENDAQWVEHMKRAGVEDVLHDGKFFQHAYGREKKVQLLLEGGGRALFKPAMCIAKELCCPCPRAVNYLSEIMAFHMDRLLGLGMIPPSVYSLQPLVALDDAHANETNTEKVQSEYEWMEEVARESHDDDMVAGALIAWVEGFIHRMSEPKGLWTWLGDPGAACAATREGLHEGQRGVHVRPACSVGRLREWSDMVVCDFLTSVRDRRANYYTLGVDGPLLLLDQGMGFARSVAMDVLKGLCVFNRGTVARVRSYESLGDALVERTEEWNRGTKLEEDPLWRESRGRFVHDVNLRVETLLRRVDECIERFGEAIWLDSRHTE